MKIDAYHAGRPVPFVFNEGGRGLTVSVYRHWGCGFTCRGSGTGGTLMALQTYDDLLTAIPKWLNKRSLTVWPPISSR
jgi:hypothetical protein